MNNLNSTIKIYLQAWKNNFHNWKLWSLLYAFNLLFGLVVVLPLYSYFKDGMGDSLALDTILQDFDWDIFSDFINSYGGGFGLFSNQFLLVLLCYLLFSAFTMGGVLHTFKIKKFFRPEFWSANSTYFWRMLRLALYFFIAQLVLAIIAFSLFKFFAKDFSINALQSEVRIIEALFGVGIPYLLLAGVLFMLHDYAKVHVVHAPATWLTRPLWASIRLSFQSFWKTYPLYLLNVLIALAFFGIYKALEMQTVVQTSGAILGLFIFSQCFIFLRIGMKLVKLDSATILYERLGE